MGVMQSRTLSFTEPSVTVSPSGSSSVSTGVLAGWGGKVRPVPGGDQKPAPPLFLPRTRTL